MRLIVILGTVVVVSACSPAPAPPPAAETPAPAAAAPAYQPVVSLNEMMVSIVDANSHHIWDVEDKAPQTDADWSEMEHAAVTLAASGNLTMLSGNGSNDQKWVAQPDWAKYSLTLSEAGVTALQAVRTKNVDGLRKAGDQLVLTCINCHREYKLDVPKIWSDHEAH
jgi:hypothetical protein